MITVTVRRLPERSGTIKLSDFTNDVLDVPAANIVAEGIASTIRKTAGDYKCEDHPNTNSTIIVTAVKGGNPRIDKSSMCCKKFADLIQVKFS